jgi:hypothetical protein
MMLGCTYLGDAENQKLTGMGLGDCPLCRLLSTTAAFCGFEHNRDFLRFRAQPRLYAAFFAASYNSQQCKDSLQSLSTAKYCAPHNCCVFAICNGSPMDIDRP